MPNTRRASQSTGTSNPPATNTEVAQSLHALRREAGLTQKELADKVGTTPSVICRLEDDTYEGHSITMLRRVAMALGRRVEVRFVS
jgi:transcriptional regulator with XRE-family HTH domain